LLDAVRFFERPNGAGLALFQKLRFAASSFRMLKKDAFYNSSSQEGIMIGDILADAVVKLRRVLDKPEYKSTYAGHLRQRIEKLIEEMDAVRLLPGIDAPPMH